MEKEDRKEAEEIVRAPFVELKEGIAEQAHDIRTGRTFYLYYDIATKQVSRKDELKDSGTIYRPIVNDHIKTRQVLLPSEVEEYGDDQKLAIEIEKYLDKYHQETDRFQRRLDILYILLTYVSFGKDCVGLLPQIPYRRRLGWYGSGKSRATEVLGAICYRPFYIAGCASEAALRRRFDLWRGTAIIDEADFSRSDLYSTITKILNIGFDSHLGYYNMQDVEDPSKSYSLYVFGPKVMSTRAEFADLALESRCITAPTSDKTKPMPISLSEGFYEDAFHLRNKLTLWRFRRYHDFKKQVRRLEDPDLETEIFGGLKVSGRIMQVIAPLWLIADQSLRGLIREMAETLDSSIKAKDETYQTSIHVREALIQLLDFKSVEIQDRNELISLIESRGYRVSSAQIISIPLRQIVQRVLEGGYDEEGTASKRVANAIRKILRFTVKAGTGNRRIVLVPLSFIGELYPDLKLILEKGTLGTFEK